MDDYKIKFTTPYSHSVNPQSTSFSSSLTPGERLSLSSSVGPTIIERTQTTSNTLLRDEYEEKQRLDKQNFDLKMKVYYLEEQLKRIQDNEIRVEQSSNHHKNEISDLKLQLEEKDIELEQRNLLLLKAKAAIETLKQELDRLREEKQQQINFEERVQRLKQMNQEIEQDFKSQQMIYEHEIMTLKQKLLQKEQEISSLDEQNKQLDIKVATIQENYNEITMIKSRLEEKWIDSQQRNASLDDELTQLRAHVDLFHLRIQEEHEEKDKLKNEVKETNQNKNNLDETYRIRIQDLTNSYEQQLRTMRTNHEQDIDKARVNHSQLIQDIRNNYQNEINQLRQQQEKTIQELRISQENELIRHRDDFNQRIHEKNEEIKALQLSIQLDKQKIDSYIHDLEDNKHDQESKQKEMDYLLHELQSKNNEIHNLLQKRQDLFELTDKYHLLQEELQQENIVKLELTIKYETIQQEKALLEKQFKEKDAEVYLLKNEINKLSYTTTELTERTSSLDNFTTENEKLRIMLQKLQYENLDLHHRNNAIKQEKEIYEKNIEKKLEEYQQMKEEIQRYQQINQEKSLLFQEKHDQYIALQQQMKNIEEQTQQKSFQLQELLQENEQLLQQLTKLSQEHKATNQSFELTQEKLFLFSPMILEALQDWDIQLQELLEANGNNVLQTNALFGTNSRNSSSTTRRSLLATPPKLYSSNNNSTVNTSPVIERYRKKFQTQINMNNENMFNLDDFKQESLLFLERIQTKLVSFHKLQQYYFTQQQTILKQIDSFEHFYEDKNQFLSSRVHELTNEITRLQTLLQRDQEKQRIESQEAKHLRQVVMAEATNKINELEKKQLEYLQKQEQDKYTIEQYSLKIKQYSEEISHMKQEYDVLQNNLQQYEQTEMILETFETKINTLIDKNTRCEQDIHRKNEHIQTLTMNYESLQSEKSMYQNELNKLTTQYEMKLTTLQEMEQRIEKYQQEIDRLRSRQIDPQLAMTILETQSQLTSTGNPMLLASSSSANNNQSNNSNYNNNNNVSELANVNQLMIVEKNIRLLSEKTEEMMRRFELLVNSLTKNVPGNRVLIEDLQQDVQSLLFENGRLMSKVLQLISSAKGSFATTSTMSLPPKATISSTTIRQPIIESSDRYFFPSRKGLMTPTSNTNAINLDDLNESFGSVDISEIRPSVYQTNASTAINLTSKLNNEEPPEERVSLSRMRSLPARTSPLKSTISMTSNAPMSSTTLQSNYLNNSSSRLTKLDRSLQMLAKKLDSFDK